MREYIFEIFEQGKVAARQVAKLPDERALWSGVELFALRMAGMEGAFIRVKNSLGETIVRVGVSTALASIDSCPVDCPLKSELRHLRATGKHSVCEPNLQPDCVAMRTALAA
jgi:hypothetical protein